MLTSASFAKPLVVEVGREYGRENFKTFPALISGKHFNVTAATPSLVTIMHTGKHPGHVFFKCGVVQHLPPLTGEQVAFGAGDQYFPVSSLEICVRFEPADAEGTLSVHSQDGGAATPLKPKAVGKMSVNVRPSHVIGTLFRGFDASARRNEETKFNEKLAMEQIDDSVNEKDSGEVLEGAESAYVPTSKFYRKPPSFYLNLVRPDVLYSLPMRGQDRNEMMKLRDQNELVHGLSDADFYNTPGGPVVMPSAREKSQKEYAAFCKLSPDKQKRIREMQQHEEEEEDDDDDFIEDDEKESADEEEVVRKHPHPLKKRRLEDDDDEPTPLAASIANKQDVIAKDDEEEEIKRSSRFSARRTLSDDSD